MTQLTLLHTAQVHVATFETLVKSIDESIVCTHVVDESLLRQAQLEGETAVLQKRLKHLIDEALTETQFILCTCSTIGDMAEKTAPERVLRVDRPMMATAIDIGGRIHIVATVESTIKPTLDLFYDVAGETAVDVTAHVISSAWPHFLSGDIPTYHQTIATALQTIAPNADVIILAQASMAGANALVNLPIPILSSPEIGVREAIKRFYALS